MRLATLIVAELETNYISLAPKTSEFKEFWTRYFIGNMQDA